MNQNTTQVSNKNISTADCVAAIVADCAKNLNQIAKEFDPILSQADLQKTLNPKNWKRMSKRRVEVDYLDLFLEPADYSGITESMDVRDFDCKPFDDQLRATVWSTKTKIVKIIIQGE